MYAQSIARREESDGEKTNRVSSFSSLQGVTVKGVREIGRMAT
jgi:hypothetical protein